MYLYFCIHSYNSISSTFQSAFDFNFLGHAFFSARLFLFGDHILIFSYNANIIRSIPIITEQIIVAGLLDTEIYYTCFLYRSALQLGWVIWSFGSLFVRVKVDFT